MEQIIYIKNKNEMSALASRLAKLSQGTEIFALKGNLGVGKSFFAQEFINALSDEKINVLSPTFNLVFSYKTKKAEIFHFDLYRLKNPQELENIGFFDALKSGICLIEWPEISQEFLPKNYVEIEILNCTNEEERKIIIKNFAHKI